SRTASSSIKRGRSTLGRAARNVERPQACGGNLRCAAGLRRVRLSSVEALQLDILAIQWSDALDAAENSLAEVSRSRRAFRLSATELHDRLTGPADRTRRGGAGPRAASSDRPRRAPPSRPQPAGERWDQRAVAVAVREAGVACVSSCPTASWTRRLAT